MGRAAVRELAAGDFASCASTTATSGARAGSTTGRRPTGSSRSAPGTQIERELPARRHGRRCHQAVDHLGIEAAHLVGASLGGMIAQTLAIRHPERVLSLTSIMSTTGDRAVGQPHPEALAQLYQPTAQRASTGSPIWGRSRTGRSIGSPGFEPDNERRSKPRSARATNAATTRRAWGASSPAAVASGDRSAELARLNFPTLVIHGEQDPLIDVSGGEGDRGGDSRRQATRDRGHGPTTSRASYGRAFGPSRSSRTRAGRAAPSRARNHVFGVSDLSRVLLAATFGLA